MSKFKKSLIAFLLPVFIMVLVAPITSCDNNSGRLNKNVEGDISIMLWSGDGSYLEDIGRREFTADEIKGQNQAAAIAVAKAFNKQYPNVKINVFAKSGGPDAWDVEIENFKAEHQKYPDVWASIDLPGDIRKGLVADLSRYKNDPLYKSFNPSIMKMMNYYGFQGGLPQFLQPWGVFVNKTLAEQKNVDVPEPDWTIDDYLDFIRTGDHETFWGAMDTPTSFISTGAEFFTKGLFNYKGTGKFVDFESVQFEEMLDYYYSFGDNAVWIDWDKGLLTEEQMASLGSWWSFKFFQNGKILTLDGDPWMMGDLANPDPLSTYYTTDNWDIYPRPSTKYAKNTVGVVLDPLAVHNYCLDDGDKACSEEEIKKMDIAYEFASFWVGKTEAWKARAEMQFLDGLVMKTALNDSMPFVTGPEFDAQMNLWYSVPTHARFKDANVMPGWHKILEIWQNGDLWDVSDKAFPWRTTDDENNVVTCGLEYLEMYKPIQKGNDVSIPRFDPAWKGEILALREDWNTKINARFEKAFSSLKEALKTNYGYTDAQLGN